MGQKLRSHAWPQDISAPPSSCCVCFLDCSHLSLIRMRLIVLADHVLIQLLHPLLGSSCSRPGFWGLSGPPLIRHPDCGRGNRGGRRGPSTLLGRSFSTVCIRAFLEADTPGLWGCPGWWPCKLLRGLGGFAPPNQSSHVAVELLRRT